MKFATDIEIKHGTPPVVVACTSDLAKKYPDVKQIIVQIFEDHDEAANHFHKVGDEGDDDGKVLVDGNEATLSLINSAHRANCMNKARAEHSRPKSVFTKLRNHIKTDASAKARLEQLLKDFDLGELEAEGDEEEKE